MISNITSSKESLYRCPCRCLNRFQISLAVTLDLIDHKICVGIMSDRNKGTGNDKFTGFHRVLVTQDNVCQNIR